MKPTETIIACLNVYGDGNHPIATAANLAFFPVDYQRRCLARAFCDTDVAVRLELLRDAFRALETSDAAKDWRDAAEVES